MTSNLDELEKVSFSMICFGFAYASLGSLYSTFTRIARFLKSISFVHLCVCLIAVVAPPVAVDIPLCPAIASNANHLLGPGLGLGAAQHWKYM